MAWVITKDIRFYLHEDETLLNGLIRNDCRPAFECCQGYCGVCKVRIHLKSGEATHCMPPLCALQNDEVLACCCMISGSVEIIDKP